MDRFREPLGDQAARCFDIFPMQFTQIRLPSGNCSLRVLFAQGTELDPNARESIFNLVYIKRFVTKDLAASWEIKLIPLERTRIRRFTWHQEEFNRFTLRRHDYM